MGTSYNDKLRAVVEEIDDPIIKNLLKELIHISEGRQLLQEQRERLNNILDSL